MPKLLTAKPLKANALVSEKPGTTRRELRDSATPGLSFVIQPTGTRSWALRVRHGGSNDGRGRQLRKITLGQFPAMTLAEARKEARDVRANPAAAIEAKRAALRQAEDADTFTFKFQSEAFLNRPNKKTGKPKRASSRKRYEGIFAPLATKWNKRDVRTITKAECEDAISEADKRGQHAKASLWMLLNGFFTWLEKRETILKSPMKTFDRVNAGSNRERNLADDELKTVWNACDQAEVFGRFIRMLMLTGQRRTEVASMRRSAINVAEKYWEIPGDKAKNEMPHVVFLSDAAMAIIEASPKIAGCDFIFTTDGETHIKGFSKGKKDLDEVAPIQHWVLNDLRRTLSTRFAKEKIVPLEIAEKILNHGKGELGGVVGVYNKWEYAPERRAAMDAWAATLARIIDGKSNVIPLRA